MTLHANGLGRFSSKIMNFRRGFAREPGAESAVQARTEGLKLEVASEARATLG